MSAPMEISFDPHPSPPAVPASASAPPMAPAAATAVVVSSSPQPSALAAAVPFQADDRALVSVEVLLHATSTARTEDVQAAVES